jgi:hypothetical protein
MMMTTVNKFTAFTIIASLCLGFSSYASAAFCSLRDPVESIKTLYPNSTSFKSSVKIIDEGIRNKVQELLPPNTLHFSELGKHTLYIVYQQDKPMGYVHVRSEESQWGLVEIAWAMTLDLKVSDFKFQRCRNRQKKVIETEVFKAQLRGKTYQDFTAMLQADGLSLNEDKVNVSAKAKSLAEIVIRCGMKTLLVTELAWSDEIQKNRLTQQAHTYFDTMVSIEVISDAVNSSISTILNTAFDGADTGIDRNSVIVAKVYDVKKKVLGMIYESQITIDQKPTRISWVMAADGKIIHVDNAAGWHESSTQQAFEKTIGRKYETSNQCNNRAELLTLEAVLTSQSVFFP